MKFKSENTKGILIAFLGALLLTPDTLFMRLSEMDVWTMLFWRGFQMGAILILMTLSINCLLYTSPSPRDLSTSRMPSSA